MHIIMVYNCETEMSDGVRAKDCLRTEGGFLIPFFNQQNLHIGGFAVYFHIELS